MVSNASVKARVDRLAEEQGLPHKRLWEALGMTESGYYRMWKRKSLKHSVLATIAKALDVPTTHLTGETGTPRLRSDTVAEPVATYGRPRFIEQRVDLLEKQVRELLALVKEKP